MYYQIFVHGSLNFPYQFALTFDRLPYQFALTFDRLPYQFALTRVSVRTHRERAHRGKRMLSCLGTGGFERSRINTWP